eukprot:XP_017445598.1 PREDICTED: glandular kallikrein-7, submandibular/renal isoform X1 [Rattus norvegicus]
MWFLVLCLMLSLGEYGAFPLIQSSTVGGWECERHSQPWQVVVYHFNRYLCGGVLIDPSWVITAAHCYNGVKVIDLPTEEPKVGSTCLASGWSSTKPLEWEFPDDLQCVNINILSNEKCIKAHTQMVTDVMLCAGELEGGKDTCNGDSGGPLLCDGVLQGITSWSSVPCGETNRPAIYTKLIKFTSWIKEVMKENS